MKHLKTFEAYKEYTDEQPINFDSVFGFSRSDMADVLSDLIDNYDFLDFDLVSDDYKKFKIEIFDENFEQDTSQDLKDEYKTFEEKIFPSLKSWLDSYNIKIEGHKLDTEKNRIVISCKQIVPLKESYNKPRKGMKSRWSTKYKKSINCNNPKGFSQRQFCARKRRGGAYKD